MRPVELWAAEVIARHLGCDVVVHDDGSEDGMFDLRVGPRDAPESAIEVTGAVDQEWVQTWNTGPARGPESWRVRGDWIVMVEPGARFKGLQQGLEPILMGAEDRPGYERVDDVLRIVSPMERAVARSLGVRRASCFRTAGTGQVNLTMGGSAAWVDDAGSSVVPWLEDFVADPSRSDNLRKLATPAGRREMFVVVTLMGAPAAVVEYLMRGPTLVPAGEPSLAEPLTGCWLVTDRSFSTSPTGVYWDGDAWAIVDTGDVVVP